MSVFRQVIPNSTFNSVNEKYQYYLVWLADNGGVRNWLFSHTDGEQEEGVDNIVIEGATDIRSIPNEHRKEVSALTTSLDSDTFDYVKSIAYSNRIYQVTMAGEMIPIAINKMTIKRPNKLKQFSLGIKFTFKEEYILNV